MRSALLTLVLLLLAFPACCISVSDGDTITVLNAENQQIKIRLYGIDSPESGQPHGRKAKQNMSALVFGQNVEIESIDQDRYSRSVARVSIDGLDICEEQLRAGHAWVFPRYYLNRDRANSALPKQRAARHLSALGGVCHFMSWRRVRDSNPRYP